MGAGRQGCHLLCELWRPPSPPWPREHYEYANDSVVVSNVVKSLLCWTVLACTFLITTNRLTLDYGEIKILNEPRRNNRDASFYGWKLSKNKPLVVVLISGTPRLAKNGEGSTLTQNVKSEIASDASNRLIEKLKNSIFSFFISLRLKKIRCPTLSKLIFCPTMIGTSLAFVILAAVTAESFASLDSGCSCHQAPGTGWTTRKVWSAGIARTAEHERVTRSTGLFGTERRQRVSRIAWISGVEGGPRQSRTARIPASGCQTSSDSSSVGTCAKGEKGILACRAWWGRKEMAVWNHRYDD